MAKFDDPGFYLLPMDHPLAVENVRRHSSRATCVENAWTKEELDWLWKNAFTDKSRPRLNRNGTVIVDTDMDMIYRRYQSKFDSLLGPNASKTPCIGGNYFITPQQYGLHQDAGREEGYRRMLEDVPIWHEQRCFTTWKNIITPLWVGSHLDELDGGQIVFFEQRDIGWAKVYNAGKQTKNIASIYEIKTDYSDIQFYNASGQAIPRELNSVPFDVEFHERYMNTPYVRLVGLTPEEVFQWEPGNPCIFDAVQLHATNEGTKGGEHRKTWNAKMGLLMMFYIELDPDLLYLWREEQNELRKNS